VDDRGERGRAVIVIIRLDYNRLICLCASVERFPVLYVIIFGFDVDRRIDLLHSNTTFI